MFHIIQNRLFETRELIAQMLNEKNLLEDTVNAARKIISSLKSGGTIFFCGNGGSAADAQHLAAELQGRFLVDRKPYSAIALTTNTSIITAITNDYDFSEIFSRQIKGIGKAKDVLFAISTSGNSKNIIQALKASKEIGMITIGLTGVSGGKMGRECDILLNVPSDQTPRIQEAHIIIGHILCELIEKEIC